MIKFNSVAGLIALAAEHKVPMSEIVWRAEVARSGRSSAAVWAEMAGNLQVMRDAVKAGLRQREKSFSGLVGGDANRLAERLESSFSLSGPVGTRAAAYALAVSEVNAGMGKIVACPTAGSCGILPGAILAVGEELGLQEESLIMGLFTAGGIGMVIAENATISGACGGCQAECGSAAAMAAGAVAEMAGGTPVQAGEALTLALKNLLGLVCDPVAGLVEVPCVKRNAFGAVHAILAADMALAGIVSVIPADEVIEAMRQIGLALPQTLRETAEGGLAKTPTALKITEQLLGGKPS